MRDLSDAMLDALNTQHGEEPIIIIEVHWTDRSTLYYSDKILGPNIRGQILSIGNLDDVVNINKSGASQNVTIVLSDVSGNLKKIYDTIDIHKRPVKIYQH